MTDEPLDVILRTISHRDQRYETCGDWEAKFFPGVANDYRISVSDTGKWQYSAALMLHEFVEAMLCRAAGISQETVDSWDRLCIRDEKDGEPGEDPACPYYNQHRQATELEFAFLQMLGVDWLEYEHALTALSPDPPRGEGGE
jgi:hypothetical protein